MKKFFSLVFVLFLALGICTKSSAATFEEAYAQSTSKPMLTLLYATWADNYSAYLTEFRNLQAEFGDKFNYVELDIASPDAKFFNMKYHIYPNLPYVLMFRDGGKISRYIQKDCAASASCMIPRVKSFIQ